MRPEDEELLRRWQAARGPDELTSERNWRALSGRIAAGDPGPALPDPTPALPLAKLAIVAAVVAGAGGGAFVWLRPPPVDAPAPVTAEPAAARGERVATGAARGGSAAAGGACRSLEGPYVDPGHLAAAPGDDRATFLHPWRGWLDTLPAAQFAEGVGIYLHLGDLRGADLDVIVGALARNGVRSVGVEFNWSHLSWDETADTEAGRTLEALLAACRRHGVRPTIRVVSHEGAPCPMRHSRRRVAAAARAGDRALVLEDARDLVPGRSGISMLSQDVVGEILVTDVRGQAVSLSRPLPFDLPAGRRLRVDTLKYRPFGLPGSTDFAETLAGWRRYLDVVADLATRALGTAGAADRGFDVELWNSIAFASRFLYLGRYYDPPGPGADDERAWRQLARETARHMADQPQRFAGVRLINGFATHAPGECPDLPPPFVGVRRATPGALMRPLLQGEDGRVADPFVWPWPTARPRGTRIAFPEVEGTWLTPESYVRELYQSRERPRACGVWISGAGIEPRVVAPLADVERAQALKAKLVLRQCSFFLGKGARRVMAGAVPGQGDPDDRGSGLLPSAFLQRARAGAEAPAVSPALAALGRLVALTAGDAAPVEAVRPLQVRDVADCHDGVQFRGGPGDPVLFNREVLVLLPFQAGPRRFVVHYYMMTRDTTADLAPERYSVTLGGLAAAGASVRAHDPLRDRAVPAQIERAGGDELTVTLEATDYPRVLTIHEPGE